MIPADDKAVQEWQQRNMGLFFETSVPRLLQRQTNPEACRTTSFAAQKDKMMKALSVAINAVPKTPAANSANRLTLYHAGNRPCEYDGHQCQYAADPGPSACYVGEPGCSAVDCT